MDVDAVLARQPAIALVDELAHTNVPGSRNAKRWQDVNELLDAGIDVISTVNIQHLESINDVVERITGIVQRETIPDDDRPGRRAGRARRHDPGGAPAADGPRQHLRRREGRRRPHQLLPAGQPRRPARARPAVGRRPGRRRPRGVPGTPRHHRAVGDPRAGRGRASPARPAPRTSSAARHVSPSGPTASCSASTSAASRAWPVRPASCSPTHRRLLEEVGGEYHEIGRQRHRRRAHRLRPSRERHPDHPRQQPPEPLARAHPGLDHQPRRAPLRPDRRPRHLPRAAAPPGPPCPACPVAAGHCRAPPPPASPGLLTLVGLPALTGAPHPGAGRHRPTDRARAVPALRRRHAAVGGMAPALVAARRRVPRRQLVLHPADPHLDDRRARERPRPRRLPAHRRHRQRPRRRRHPPHRRGRPRRRRGPDPVRAGQRRRRGRSPAGADRRTCAAPFGLAGVALLRRADRRLARRGRRRRQRR